MFRKIFTILIGIGCFWYGIHILKEGVSYMYGFPISKGTGFIILGFGIVLILYGCFQKIRSKQSELSFSICPNCKKSLYSADVPDGLCPNCKVRLENLSGFYERHPELRDD